MTKRIFRYLAHIFGTVFTLAVIGATVIIAMNGTFDYNQNDLGLNLDREGPYVFIESDSTFIVNYIRGNKHEGFYLDTKAYQFNNSANINCYFPLDQTKFDINLNPNFEPPKTFYNDG